jgi:hypothetical protein
VATPLDSTLRATGDRFIRARKKWPRAYELDQKSFALA